MIGPYAINILTEVNKRKGYRRYYLKGAIPVRKMSEFI